MSRDALRREVWVASLGILLLMLAVKGLAPVLGDHVYTAAAAAQLLIPIGLVGRRGITDDTLGLTWEGWPKDLALTAAISAATVLPFALGHHLWQTQVFGRVLVFALPAGLATDVLNQVLGVALPEELFYRGYLQSRMSALWPARRTLFGTPFGLAIVLASTVFALAHFVGEWAPHRLGPFFPSLLFGLLRARTGGLLAPVAYHAFCNLLADVLHASYRPA